MQKKLINDTIYNHIEYSKLEGKILQTHIVNRLLFVTQNALAYFAYPSINTKRYIHSLGTMHLSSHIFKNALLNADTNVKNDFIKGIGKSIKNIIKEQKLDLVLNDYREFSDKSLYEFMIPLNNPKHTSIYFITLQAVRIVGLLHDVGHFPFSHQVEYSMQRVYRYLSEKNDKYTKKEKVFLEFYEDMTQKNTLVLHEAVGVKLIKMLFEYELLENDLNDKELQNIKLIYKIVMNILCGEKDKYFDYSSLHKIVDSTVDADRLDYINRDMLASGYISGSVDFIRLTKHAVLLKTNYGFDISFYDSELIDIEQMLEMRFNLYKKIIYNHKIALTDTLLENVILFLVRQYFDTDVEDSELTNSISMLWRFFEEDNFQKRLDIVSQLDENWLITLFKKEYFKIKYKQKQNFDDKKYLISFEEILFGKKLYNSMWKNLNDLYKVIGFDEKQRYQFRESFGYVSEFKLKKLQTLLDEFCFKYEREDLLLSYHIVSINIGIDKEFSLYDGEKLIKIDEVSTLRKRLKKSILNTVPFYIYASVEKLSNEMIIDINKILNKVFLI